MGFEPTISAGERPQPDVLDGAATGTGTMAIVTGVVGRDMRHNGYSNRSCWKRHEAQHLSINPLNDELNPICHLLALLGAHHILHVRRVRVKVKFNDCRSGSTIRHEYVS